MNNRYGVDVPYFTKELAALSRSLDDRTPDELNRYLLCLAKVAKPLKSVERRKTVRRKPPVQQRKGRICPQCKRRSIPVTGFPWCSCGKCGYVYAGKLQPVA